MPNYWLMKTEPETFSIADLARVGVEPWTGVRSMFARFHMRAMAAGDDVLFYHSSCEPPGVAGLARVVRTRVVDETQFDPASPYFDPKATRERPIWDCAEVEYVATLPRFVSLGEIRAEPSLADMALLKRGMRLSVQPITEHHYRTIVALASAPAPAALAQAAPRAARARSSPSSPRRAAPVARPARTPRTARTPRKATSGTSPARPGTKRSQHRGASRGPGRRARSRA